MNNPLSFRAGAAASLNKVQAARGISSPAASTATQPAGGLRTGPGQRPGIGGAAPVHMAAEEMERHVSDALEDSPVLTDSQAPVIDPELLDAPADEIDEPQFEGDDFETVEFAENEPADTAEDPEEARTDADGQSGREADSELEAYLVEELKAYQRDKALPAKRQARLLKDRDGRGENPLLARLATACEGGLGGLARSLPGMPAELLGLAGDYRGSLFLLQAPAAPAQLQGLPQQLRQHLSRAEIGYVLLDLGRIPPAHQLPLIKALNAQGVPPKTVLCLLGPGKSQWN